MRAAARDVATVMEDEKGANEALEIRIPASPPQPFLGRNKFS